jgi:hypothetical protein
VYKPSNYLVVIYLPTYKYETYFLANWLPRWNHILTQLKFIHNWVITGIQWMVWSWESVLYGQYLRHKANSIHVFQDCHAPGWGFTSSTLGEWPMGRFSSWWKFLHYHPCKMVQNYSCISFLMSAQFPNKMCVMKSLEWWNFALSSLHTENMYNSGVQTCLGITHIFLKKYESG